MSTTWLEPSEVEELTDRKRWTAQCRKLASMGVPFRPNAVGRPLVERAAVDHRSPPLRKAHHFEGIGPKHALGLVSAPPPIQPTTRPSRAQRAALAREEAALAKGRKAQCKRLHAARMTQAKPPWADVDAIAAVYVEAQRMTARTGVPHEVDHVVPLLGKHVCGLHWEGNLRVVPRKTNRSKGNRMETTQ